MHERVLDWSCAARATVLCYHFELEVLISNNRVDNGSKWSIFYAPVAILVEFLCRTFVD